MSGRMSPRVRLRPVTIAWARVMATRCSIIGRTNSSKVFGSTSRANWNRSRALMQRGRFSPLQRELIATAVSVANACTY